MRLQPTQIFTQIGYGSAELGVSAIESFLRLYLLIFLTSSVGLSADLAGFAVSIGIIWDAFADPIMGKISDKTQSRWGRRLPWIFLGTPILAATFVLIFDLQDLKLTNQPVLVFWKVTILNILLNTAMTMVSVPHLALGNEIITDPPLDRTATYAWRSAMTLFGFLVGILVPAIVNAAGIKLTQPEFTFAAIIGVVSVCASLITLWSCRSHITFIPASSDQNRLEIKALLRGKLGLLMLAFFVATFAQGLNSVLAMYYYRFSLGLDDQAVGKILVVFVLSLCLTIPFWVTAANRYSKAHLIAFGTIGLGFMGSALYPIFPTNQLAGPYLMAVVGGVLLGTSGLLESFLVDAAERQNIKSQEMGLVFGLWKFMAKSARGISIAIGGKLLAFSGYSPSIAPSESVAANIAWIFGPGVGVFFVLTGALLLATNRNTAVISSTN